MCSAGVPSLQFFNAMKAEHCTKFGFDIKDTTSNYKILTCPKTEWLLVLQREGKSDFDFKTVLNKEFPEVKLGKEHHNRRIPDITLLLLLPSSIIAKLTREEIIAIVLYTGPMVSPFFLDLCYSPFHRFCM